MSPRPCRVLRVEDDPSNVELFTAVLELDGDAVEVVTDGRGVEPRVHAVRPDLVLMDITAAPWRGGSRPANGGREL